MIRGFLRHLSWRAHRLGVEFRLDPGPSIPYQGNVDLPVSGFFVESPTPVLGVAIGKDPQEWLEILAHEASHMDQWAEGSVHWTNNTMADGREAVDWVDEWISGKELSEQDLLTAFSAAKAVELDCEKRTVRKALSFGLPIDVQAYSQRANAYVHFYDHVRNIRRWNESGKAPYQLPEVWATAPTHIVDEAPQALKKAFEQHWEPRAPDRRNLKP
jgi:hypothetical protein